MARKTGRRLSEEYGLQVRESWLNKNGKWYHNATQFPCAFHDSEGVVIVRDEEHWKELQINPADGSTYFIVTKETHVHPPGIKGMRGYIPHSLLTQVIPELPEDFLQGPDEVTPDRMPPVEYHEGAIRRVTVNAYERDPNARRKCIEAHGSRCVVCGFCFGERYGKNGAGYIHVHHLRPLSMIGANYKVNPEEDMCPLCPNCHAMAHRRRPNPYTLNELKDMLVRY